MLRIPLMAILVAFAASLSLAQEPDDTNYDEAKVPSYELPNALVDNAGQSVGREEWVAHRRAEIQRLFEDSVYGATPTRKLTVRYEVIESDPNALDGRATRKQVAAFFGDDEYRIDILLYIPNKSTGPVAGFVGLNFNGNHTIHAEPEIIERDTGKTRGQKVAGTMPCAVRPSANSLISFGHGTRGRRFNYCGICPSSAYSCAGPSPSGRGRA